MTILSPLSLPLAATALRFDCTGLIPLNASSHMERQQGFVFDVSLYKNVDVVELYQDRYKRTIAIINYGVSISKRLMFSKYDAKSPAVADSTVLTSYK